VHASVRFAALVLRVFCWLQVVQQATNLMVWEWGQAADPTPHPDEVLCDFFIPSKVGVVGRCRVIRAAYIFAPRALKLEIVRMGA
jgi:hypothetical protein